MKEYCADEKIAKTLNIEDKVEYYANISMLNAQSQWKIFHLNFTDDEKNMYYVSLLCLQLVLEEKKIDRNKIRFVPNWETLKSVTKKYLADEKSVNFLDFFHVFEFFDNEEAKKMIA